MKKFRTLIALSSILLCVGCYKYKEVKYDNAQTDDTKNDDNKTEETKTDDIKPVEPVPDETNPSTTKKYTITWIVNETNTISTVEEGKVPEYNGATPTKAKTAEYTYTFVGWNTSSTATTKIDIPKATQNQTYYAIFSKTKNKYKITFKVEGQTDKQVDYEYGATPSYGSTPTKAKTAEYTYSFVGWNTSSTATSTITLPKVTQDQTYYAIFNSTKNKYRITFKVEGQADKQVDFEYGATPSYGSTPTKAKTDEYSYTFVGWNTSSTATSAITLPKVTQNQTYYAIFSSTKNKYRITFKVEGQSDKQLEYEYGATPDYGSTPFKGNETETYEFLRWEPEITSVTANATYTAVFSTESTERKYTITFALNDDTIVKTAEYDYNTAANSITLPTHNETYDKTDDKMRFVRDGVTYDFTGWGTIEVVKSNKTYYATGTQVDNPGSKTKYFAFNLSGSEIVYRTTLVLGSNTPLYRSDGSVAYNSSTIVRNSYSYEVSVINSSGHVSAGSRSPAHDYSK